MSLRVLGCPAGTAGVRLACQAVLEGDAEAPLREALAKLKADKSQVKGWRVSKKSVDARDKGNVHFVMSVDISLKNEDLYLRAAKPGTVVKVQRLDLVFPISI